MAAHVWPWREIIISIRLARYKIHTELTLHISERIDRKRQLQPHGQRLRRHLPSAKQSLSGHTDTHTKPKLTVKAASATGSVEAIDVAAKGGSRSDLNKSIYNVV